MTSFCCLQVSFIRSCGKYSPSNFDVKNIDLYNIIILRSIDAITSLYALLTLMLLLTLHKIILEVLMLLYFSLILVVKKGLLIPFVLMLIRQGC